MKIRHAEVKDVEEIQEIALATWTDTYEGIIDEDTIEDIVDSWYDRDDLTQQVKDPLFLVAEADEGLKGYIHASVRNGGSHLHRLYVRPENQGEGIGGDLYDRAEQEIIEAGVERIELEVMAENSKGLGFYRSKGFEEEKEESVFVNGEEVVQKVLVKKL